MARIPGIEGFGEAVARPVSFNQTQTPAGAFGGQIANTLANIGADMAREEAQERAQIEQRRVQADRGQGALSIKRGQSELDMAAEEFADEILQGRVKPEEAEAEWLQRGGEISKRMTEGLGESFQFASETLDAETQARTRLVRRAIFTKYRDDTRGSLLGLLEEAEREALGDRPKAVERAQLALANLGPAAGLGADDQVRMLSKFKESAAFVAGRALVRGARDNPAELDAVMARLASPEYSDLAPAQVGQLEQEVLGRKAYLASQESVRIARAEARAARQQREAESAFTAAQSLIEGGAVPAPDYVAGVAAKTAGTPYAAAFTELLRDASTRAGFAQLSPQQQQAELVALRTKANTEGSTPRLEKMISTFERQHAAGETDRQKDALLWGLNRRIIDDLQPLQFTQLDELVPQLQRRAEQARTVAARAGAPVSPLLSAEADRVASVLASLPLEQRVRSITQLAKSVDTDLAQAMAAQISPKDAYLGLAMFAAANSTAPRSVPGLILRGADAVKAGRVSDDAAAKLAEKRIARDLAAVPWATTAARDSAVKAAQLIYQGMRDESGGSASPADAIKLATGGIAEWSGGKVPLPPGMDERRFSSTLRSLDAKRVAMQAGADQVAVGGRLLSVDALVANMGAVRLLPAGPGIYALDSGGQMVMTLQGRPLRLNLNTLGN